MQNPVIQQIIQAIIKEDTFKLFTGQSSPNVISVVNNLNETSSLQDVRMVLIHFFNNIIQNSDPFNFSHSEAQRMLKIVDKIFSEIPKEYLQPLRDANDDIVDLYMESLKIFSKDIDDPILNKHIWYLEN